MSVRIARMNEAGAADAVYQQEFSVRYDYPVHFTEHLFARDNPAFAQALTRREPAKRHRLAVFVDANVAASWPALLRDIEGYVQAHGESLHLATRPEIIPGGEHVKNDPALLKTRQSRSLHRKGVGFACLQVAKLVCAFGIRRRRAFHACCMQRYPRARNRRVARARAHRAVQRGSADGRRAEKCTHQHEKGSEAHLHWAANSL